MEDILASIRRILNEEEAKPAEPAAAFLPAEEVLELDHSMMVPEPEAPRPAPPLPHPVARPAVMADLAPAHPPVIRPLPPSPIFSAELAPQHMDHPHMTQSTVVPLIAPETAAAAATSVGALIQTLAQERSTAVHRGGPTIEDLVRDEVRPLLKEWLDVHLPPVVERLVRAEIERVINRMS